MAKIDEVVKKQIERTDARYRERQKEQENRNANIYLGGDWRKVETPQRVLRRMVALGLNDLAGTMMGTEAVTDGVESAIQRDKKVSLLERIIEENDLLSSRFLHIGSTVARAIGRILIRSRGRIVGYGTGFLVSSRLLMTNNHVLETETVAGRSAVEFDYYERRTGQTGPTVLFEFEPQLFFLTDEDLDFTLVAVKTQSTTGTPLTEQGWIPLITDSGKALIGEPVNIIQHPRGAPQQIVIKNNEIADCIDDFLHYKADTEPGSSGSPVFNMQWELAALHHSGVPKRDAGNRILLRDNTVWDGTRSTMDRIAWIANEGVRISSIVRFIKEALGDECSPERDIFEEAIGKTPVTLPEASPQFPAAKTIPPSAVATLAEGFDDDALDRLTPEEVAAIIAELEDYSLEVTREAAAPGEVLVAEGDSWFDYGPAGLDIIDCLKKFYSYRIHNVAKAGDTLDNIAWGSEYDHNWNPKPPPLDKTLDAVRRYHPRVVLLSGGGNDFAGDELLSLLNHKKSGLPAIRQEYADFVFNTYSCRAYEEIINNIWEIDDTIHIITHGYGYGQPDGRAVIRILGFSFFGPWLRPALTAKGYTKRQERERIICDLVDQFNEMLEKLSEGDVQGRIHYINLRPLIRSRDWENELHLKNSAYRRVAERFDAVIKGIFAGIGGSL
jgi:V8-like Glu-specific endopeptidase